MKVEHRGIWGAVGVGCGEATGSPIGSGFASCMAPAILVGIRPGPYHRAQRALDIRAVAGYSRDCAWNSPFLGQVPSA